MQTHLNYVGIYKELGSRSKKLYTQSKILQQSLLNSNQHKRPTKLKSIPDIKNSIKLNRRN